MLEQLREGDARLRRFVLGVASAVVLVAGAMLLARDATHSAAMAQASNDYWLKWTIVGVVAALLLMIVARAKGEVAAVLLIAFVLVVDLGSFARRIIHALPGQMLDPHQATRTLDPDRDAY